MTTCADPRASVRVNRLISLLNDAESCAHPSSVGDNGGTHEHESRPPRGDANAALVYTTMLADLDKLTASFERRVARVVARQTKPRSSKPDSIGGIEDNSVELAENPVKVEKRQVDTDSAALRFVSAVAGSTDARNALTRNTSGLRRGATEGANA